MHLTTTSAEHRRLADAAAGSADWQRWGTYVSDRAWGTVREDYSADGSAWDYFPHEHARSRAYRWNEDGLAGFCDRDQHLCLALALWNERDTILKERLFGLSNREGNHGEDVKEYYFYLDNTPTHSYARMLYKYPQVAFPYADLVEENAHRGPDAPEYELFDAIAEAFLQNRYFDVFVEYAKGHTDDILCRIQVVNRGPEPAPIHVVPTLWYRNTWSWTHDAARHVIRADGPGARTWHPALGERFWYVQVADGTEPTLLFTENDTNTERIFGALNDSPHVKDGINDAIVSGRSTAVNGQRGSKAGAHLRAIVGAGETFTVQVRFCPRPVRAPFDGFDAIVEQRRREADEFYDHVHALDLSADERLVQRQAYAGLLWSKQFYHFDVHRWLEGDPAQPPPPAERWTGRNRDWALHFHYADVVLMPDKWEYPWHASWDLAFQVVVMAAIDPEFAKQQILLLMSPRSQHPYGTVPAFEWDFDAVNPPVIAWAAWQVYLLDRAQHDGEGDTDFLATAFDALALMLGWWVNRKDSEGAGIFGGGFLGLDNIGVFDRNRPLPTGGRLEQSDGTGWMAMFQLNMMSIALELGQVDRRYLPFVHRFGQHFAMVTNVLQRTGAGGGGLWSDDDCFYFDVIRHDSARQPLRIFSMAGLVPLFASMAIDTSLRERLPQFAPSVEDVLHSRQDLCRLFPSWVVPAPDGTRLLSVLSRERLASVLERVLDESQFLSEYGIRSLSRAHLAEPYRFDAGGEDCEVRYVPGESDGRMFGGNSNWRGPIWFPMNFLLIQSIATFSRYYGDSFTVECPTGSGRHMTLAEVADELATRATQLLVRDGAGRRAVLGGNEYMQRDPHWRDCVPFHEFFHGDTGAGLGASHQTGWTALVALLLQYRGALAFDALPAAELLAAQEVA
ncbi:MAG TPA: hypothetical protein VKE51_17815 [Vicinamibacterales bacterium]|nr:hypothetical protein [Vicinamibacterales bacterium]